MRMSWVVRSAAAVVAIQTAMPAASPALVQTWPTRAITMIVPFPAGGSTDVLGRALGEFVGGQLGQSVIIDNRAGAGGNIGAAAVAKAAPDGYTILLATPSIAATNKLMYANMAYDPDTDFAPIVLIGASPLIIATKPAAPYKSLAELIAFAKTNAGKLNAGFPGNGTLGHITGILLENQAGIKMAHVQYRGGEPLMNDLMGGHVDVAMDFISAYVPLVQDGKVRPLAVTSRTRWDQLRDVPTVAETGFAGFEASAWFCLLAPAAIPGDILDRINGSANAFVASDKGKALMIAIGVQPAGGTPAALEAHIAAEVAKWAPIIKAADIRF